MYLAAKFSKITSNASTANFVGPGLASSACSNLGSSLATRVGCHIEIAVLPMESTMKDSKLSCRVGPNHQALPGFSNLKAVSIPRALDYAARFATASSFRAAFT